MALDTGFQPSARRSRIASRQQRLLTYAAGATAALAVAAVILYPLVLVLSGLFAP